MIRVQENAFDVGAEISGLKRDDHRIGGTAVFVGTVRDLTDGKTVSSMTLEHYPGMTEKALQEIEAEAGRRWNLLHVLIVHRFGPLRAGDDIVLVICCSEHREAAFSACQFLMDWLKTKAPFWKLEEAEGSATWVEAKETDDIATARWLKADR